MFLIEINNGSEALFLYLFKGKKKKLLEVLEGILKSSK